MRGARIIGRRNRGDEAEKPFWISYADIMTALMVLFLVVMGVALLAITKKVTDSERKAKQHRDDIEHILEALQQAARRYPGVRIDRDRYVIDFGARAHFAFRMYTLAPEDEAALRQFVPEILRIANSDLGRRILKRIVVVGYTDKTGSYLANLNLSLQRSESVLCAMFATRGADTLSDAQKESILNLFLVGGYSFNAARDTDAESRRVEMRLEFLAIDERRASILVPAGNYGDCALP